ncbi:Uncharacterised protein [Vibrio cholerae]|nr:Uncharacterised protein [Vibrio cholerae]CSC19372.1 Uncharacterised protein [Vibrio cholerae]CSC89013.1 Uncharacterised protein [Vibrio cholerae]CSI23290.1 Uncharacterised protein [Vibrio cholerae]
MQIAFQHLALLGLQAPIKFAFARTHAKVERDFDRRTLVYNEYRIHHIFFVFLLCRLQQGVIAAGIVAKRRQKTTDRVVFHLSFTAPRADISIGNFCHCSDLF